MYATLAEKIGTKELLVRFLYNASPALDFPGVTIYPTSHLMVMRLNTTQILPLIQFSAMLEESDWYQYVPEVYTMDIPFILILKKEISMSMVYHLFDPLE